MRWTILVRDTATRQVPYGSLFCRQHPRFPPEKRIHRAALDVTVVRRDPKSFALLFSELDVPNPSTDG
jgi:hypothetical protein